MALASFSTSLQLFFPLEWQNSSLPSSSLVLTLSMYDVSEVALNIKARRAIPELLIIMNNNRVTPGRGRRAAFILMTSRRDARAVEMLSNDINK